VQGACVVYVRSSVRYVRNATQRMYRFDFEFLEYELLINSPVGPELACLLRIMHCGLTAWAFRHATEFLSQVFSSMWGKITGCFNDATSWGWSTGISL
jgi:hypothetical protein